MARTEVGGHRLLTCQQKSNHKSAERPSVLTNENADWVRRSKRSRRAGGGGNKKEGCLITFSKINTCNA